MLFGGNAFGRWAFGQDADQSSSTVVLTAAEGSFALTGKAATFQSQETAAGGSFALTGETATFQTQFGGASGGAGGVGFGSFALSGKAATFQDQFVAAQGSFALTGEGALFRQQLPAAVGGFAETGLATKEVILQRVLFLEGLTWRQWSRSRAAPAPLEERSPDGKQPPGE